MLTDYAPFLSAVSHGHAPHGAPPIVSMSASTPTPAGIVSLDFEMRRGVNDAYGSDIDAYRENLTRVRDAVPALLKLFAGHDIRATWVAVGALGCANWNEYFERAPEPPNYENGVLRIKHEYADLDPEGELHFAP